MDDEVPFEGFAKIPRLSRNCVITEKIDGTNAQIYIRENGEFLTGSRNRWITPDDDNFGFSKWAHEHKDELVEGLGIGRHFGEWWGSGIQRRYGLDEKRWSLFNTGRWNDETPPPACCHVVPVLYAGEFGVDTVNTVLDELNVLGSVASPGFTPAEGVVVYHAASRQYFKKTIDGDAEPKSKQAAA